MKLTGRKVLGFFILIIILTIIFFVLLAVNPELLKILGNTILELMFYSFILLIAGNTTTKAIKSIWFRKDLCENGKDNEEN